MSFIPDTDNRINELIVKCLTNDIDAEELGLLQLWISGSMENREMFNNLKNSWQLAGIGHDNVQFDTEKSFSKFSDKIENTPRKTVATISVFLRRYAAVGLVFLLTGAVLAWFVKPSPAVYGKINTVVSAPLGSKSIVTLPDGTNVWLNAGSKIEYSPDFGKETRTVLLLGEAFFSVAKDKYSPFLVKTDHVVVKALGTRFNVKAYPEEKTITTTLEEGKIEVETLVQGTKRTQKIMLKPNEKVVYYKQSTRTDIINEASEKERIKNENLKSLAGVKVTKNVNTALYTSWKDKRWILESEPLGVLGVVMERRFNIVIVFAQEELKNYKFTGTIENETLEQILDAFKFTAPINYKINRDTVFFTLDKNLKERYNKITEY